MFVSQKDRYDKRCLETECLEELRSFHALPVDEKKERLRAAREQTDIWSKYYRKTVRQRQELLRVWRPTLTPDVASLAAGDCMLPTECANVMVENCVGCLGLPLGVCPTVVVNGRHRAVPMAIEEPSVIAALSGACKLISTEAGGFVARATASVMTAQIQLLKLRKSVDETLAIITRNNALYVTHANAHLCKAMHRRGGGLLTLKARVVEPRVVVVVGSETHSEDTTIDLHKCDSDTFVDSGKRKRYIVVELFVDVCEAMGANVVNTVAEGISSLLAEDCHCTPGLRIVSNLCVSRRARAQFAIPVSALSYKKATGKQVADGILSAQRFAMDDELRAVTNNKGVMNGIDAVAIALGQDFRAMEAAAHSYACRRGFYGPLCDYRLMPASALGLAEEYSSSSSSSLFLVGSLELPIAAASKGGALGTHPGYRVTHHIADNPTAAEIAQLLCCVGLAQNFAALRALSGEGIQRGHMSMHARNIAAMAKVPIPLIEEVVTYMIAKKRIDVEMAKHYLNARKIFEGVTELKMEEPSTGVRPMPSSLFVELQPMSAPSTVSSSMDLMALDSGSSEEAADGESSSGLLQSAKIALIPQMITVVCETHTSKAVHLDVRSGGPQGGHLLFCKVFGHSFAWFETLYRYLDSVKLQALIPARCNLQTVAELKLASILVNVAVGHLLATDWSRMEPFVEWLIEHLVCDSAAVPYADADASDCVLFGQSVIRSLLHAFVWRVQGDVRPVHGHLADCLLEEQCAILRALLKRQRINDGFVKPAAESSDAWSAVRAAVEGIAKRYQLTMVLLLDASVITPSALTTEVLELIKQMGAVFEFHSYVSHSLWEARHACDGLPQSNAFAIWRQTQTAVDGESVGDQLALFQDAFFTHVEKRSERIRDKHSVQRKTFSQFFDIAVFEESIRQVQNYYLRKVA